MDLSRFRVPSAVNEVFYIPEFVNRVEEEYLHRKITESSNVKWRTLPDRRLQIWGGELTPSNALIPQQFPNFVTDYPDIIQRLRNTGVFAASKHGGPNHIIVNEYRPGQGIMPHEDGPSYYPVVATLSLSSHAVFNYYQYVSEQYSQVSEDHPASHAGAATPVSTGRVIDPNPVLSLLLEPRSLVITAKALYSHHLHAIEPLDCDILAPGELNASKGHENQHESQQDTRDRDSGIRVANWQMLRGDAEGLAAREGGVLQRKTRISLTCRDVERVVGAKTLGKMFIKK